MLLLNNQDINPKALNISLIKSSNFNMLLDSKRNHPFFEGNNFKQAFAIQGPSGGDQLCPRYSIRIIYASLDHAVILQNCYSDEAAPGTVKFSSDYYLYDVKTAIILDFWRSGMEAKKVPLAFVRPDPIVKKIENGYRIDWAYRNETFSQKDTLNMHNIYHYGVDDKAKTIYMNCKDLTKTHGTEGDLCEQGGDLKAIVDNRNSTH
ncbi:hypothetical protein VOM14_20840 [Paraburkholderia sp. MPAMCS5]|uniref:hypothetical protein n=1 Tax=Paraburkholderia sp. MPAMCS5 TaxID=3112563 RepID=UPI002E17867D|nr:hypothetical protein [Paraburkholderia sp. MPAMCS5]